MDLPTLPVSTNISLSSHTQTYKNREPQPAKGSTDDGFKYRCDERARLDGFTKRKKGWREGESSEGEHGRIKGVIQSRSLVGLLESRWLSAGMRINTRHCDAGPPQTHQNHTTILKKFNQPFLSVVHASVSFFRLYSTRLLQLLKSQI